MDKNVAIFLFGLLLLILFGWYFFTDSERVKRNLGTSLTILLTGLCIWFAYPPFDRKDASGQAHRRTEENPPRPRFAGWHLVSDPSESSGR